MDGRSRERLRPPPPFRVLLRLRLSLGCDGDATVTRGIDRFHWEQCKNSARVCNTLGAINTCFTFYFLAKLTELAWTFFLSFFFFFPPLLSSFLTEEERRLCREVVAMDGLKKAGRRDSENYFTTSVMVS